MAQVAAPWRMAGTSAAVAVVAVLLAWLAGGASASAQIQFGTETAPSSGAESVDVPAQRYGGADLATWPSVRDERSLERLNGFIVVFPESALIEEARELRRRLLAEQDEPGPDASCGDRWERAQTANDPDVLEALVAACHDSPFVPRARLRLKQLEIAARAENPDAANEHGAAGPMPTAPSPAVDESPPFLPQPAQPRLPERSPPVHEVVAGSLSLRGSPTTDVDTAIGILIKADRVRILRPVSDGWARVKVLWSDTRELIGHEGWLNAAHLRPHLPRYVVTGDFLNVRREPRISGETILGLLSRGDRVAALGDPVGGWRKVRVVADATGRLTGTTVWVSDAYLRPEQTPGGGATPEPAVPALQAQVPQPAESPAKSSPGARATARPSVAATVPGPVVVAPSVSHPGASPVIPEGCVRLSATSAVKLPVFPLTRLWPALPEPPVVAGVYEMGDVLEPIPKTVAPAFRCQTDESRRAFWGIRMADGSLHYAAPVIVVRDQPIEIRRGMPDPSGRIGTLGRGDALELVPSSKAFPTVRKDFSYVRVLRSRTDLRVAEGELYWAAVSETWWSFDRTDDAASIDVGKAESGPGGHSMLTGDTDLRSSPSATSGTTVRRLGEHERVEVLGSVRDGQWTRVRTVGNLAVIEGWVRTGRLHAGGTEPPVDPADRQGDRERRPLTLASEAQLDTSCNNYLNIIAREDSPTSIMMHRAGFYALRNGRWDFRKRSGSVGAEMYFKVLGYCEGPRYTSGAGEDENTYAIVKIVDSQASNFITMRESAKEHFLVRRARETLRDSFRD